MTSLLLDCIDIRNFQVWLRVYTPQWRFSDRTPERLYSRDGTVDTTVKAKWVKAQNVIDKPYKYTFDNYFEARKFADNLLHEERKSDLHGKLLADSYSELTVLPVNYSTDSEDWVKSSDRKLLITALSRYVYLCLSIMLSSK